MLSLVSYASQEVTIGNPAEELLVQLTPANNQLNEDHKPAEAAALINAIRQRAAYRSTNTAVQNTAAAAALTITPAQATIDFLLDERTRELYGEYVRWQDLVRPQTLKTRLERYNPTPGFRDFYVLRPIPQWQIDLTTTGPKFPHNPGY